jgi:hypothetical protein
MTISHRRVARLGALRIAHRGVVVRSRRGELGGRAMAYEYRSFAPGCSHFLAKGDLAQIEFGGSQRRGVGGGLKLIHKGTGDGGYAPDRGGGDYDGGEIAPVWLGRSEAGNGLGQGVGHREAHLQVNRRRSSRSPPQSTLRHCGFVLASA